MTTAPHPRKPLSAEGQRTLEDLSALVVRGLDLLHARHAKLTQTKGADPTETPLVREAGA